MKTRFRFSLRTLLLATLFAGSVMLCWRVRESWAFSQYLPPPSESINFGGQPAKELVSWNTIMWSKIDFTVNDDHLILNGQSYGSEDWKRYVSPFISVIDAKSGAVIVSPACGKRVYSMHGNTCVLNKVRLSNSEDAFEYRVLDLSTRQELCHIQAHDSDVANFDKTGAHLIIHKKNTLECYNTSDWKRFLSVPLPDDLSAYQFIDNYQTLIIGQSILPDNTNSFGEVVIISAIRCADQKVVWKWQSDLLLGMSGLNLAADEGKKRVSFSVSPGVIMCRYSQTSFTLDFSNSSSIQLLDHKPSPEYYDIQLLNDSVSTDGRWFMACGRVKNRIILDDIKSKQENVCAFSTQNYSARCAAMSHDSRKIAAVVDNNALAIWTRRREHFEWWGIYEQAEFWVAVLFFGALVWSIRRDWAERNGVGQGVKLAA